MTNNGNKPDVSFNDDEPTVHLELEAAANGVGFPGSKVLSPEHDSQATNLTRDVPAITTEEFFNVLYPDLFDFCLQVGLQGVRVRRSCLNIKQAVTFCQNHRGNVYFKHALQEQTPDELHRKEFLTAICIPFEESNYLNRAATREFSLPPSIVVQASSRRNHQYDVYWLLDGIYCSCKHNGRMLWAIYEGLSRAMGCDNYSQGRNLPIPGTLDSDIEPPRPLQIVEWHPDRRYAPTTFCNWLGWPMFADIPGFEYWIPDVRFFDEDWPICSYEA